VKQLLARESSRRLYRKLGNLLNRQTNQGLVWVDVPDSAAASPNPTELAMVVKDINRQQYHQAHHTPFGSGPLADQVGRRGDTDIAIALLNGNLPPHTNTLMPKTKRVLHTLAQKCPNITDSPVITTQAFKNTYKVAKETTSSSPSGRHIGHYKAAIKDDSLSYLHATMMSIPFQVGLVPERWKRVTDIMLEKSADSRCHRLRIIALFESDLNHAKHILIGRRISHLIEDKEMLSEMQFGSRPGKRCMSAVLRKILQHDQTRILKTTAAFVENDATGCYDRLINNIILMVLKKLGLPSTVTSFLGSLWDEI
jgi:hypothetical protein